MSIIIKGMEMPNSCEECEFCDIYDHGEGDEFTCELTWAYTFDYFDYKSGRLPNCPLVELPSHGLIDKQMLLRNIADNQMANSGQRHDLEYGFWQRMWDYINDAPTIIEAEGEKE